MEEIDELLEELDAERRGKIIVRKPEDLPVPDPEETGIERWEGMIKGIVSIRVKMASGGGSATPRQVGAVNSLLRVAGAKNYRHEILSLLIGRRVDTAYALTALEASFLIDAMKKPDCWDAKDEIKVLIGSIEEFCEKYPSANEREFVFNWLVTKMCDLQ